jgi:hypothetical protein
MNNLKKYNNTYVILQKDYKIYNSKIHDLLNIHFKKNYCIKHLTIKEVFLFIESNNDINVKIIFYFQNMPNFGNDILDFINKKNILSKVFIFTFDFWVREPNDFYKFILEIFKAKNYKVFTFAENIEQLNYYHNRNYNVYQNNIFFNNIWCSYNSSFIKYNDNPLMKLFISGAISNNYPERQEIIKYKNIITYKYNKNDIINNNDHYNKELNKYIACFSSSVYVNSLTTNKLENTHALLQKNFEILSSGSLLVVPKIEEPYLNKYKLYHCKNCFFINFNINIQEQINYILNNKNLIDKIRLNGKEHAKNNLNSYSKFIEIDNIIQNS